MRLRFLIALLLPLAPALAAPEPAPQPGVLYKVQSTEVAWLVYEDKTSTLLLGRRDGFVYEYQGVPIELFRQLMANDFMGGFVKANIDRKFPSRQARTSRKA